MRGARYLDGQNIDMSRSLISTESLRWQPIAHLQRFSRTRDLRSKTSRYFRLQTRISGGVEVRSVSRRNIYEASGPQCARAISSKCPAGLVT